MNTHRIKHFSARAERAPIGALMHPVRLVSVLFTTSFIAAAAFGCGPPCGGGSLNLAVTNYSTNNTANHMPYQPAHVTGTVASGQSTLTIQAGFCTNAPADINRSMTIFVHGTPAAGMSYNVTTHTDGSDTYITYAEGPANAAGTSQWHGRSGTVLIDTIQGQTVTFHINGVLFEPDNGSAGMAQGTFTYDGTGRVESVVGLH